MCREAESVSAKQNFRLMDGLLNHSSVEWGLLGTGQEVLRRLTKLPTHFNAGEWLGWDYVPSSKAD